MYNCKCGNSYSTKIGLSVHKNKCEIALKDKAAADLKIKEIYDTYEYDCPGCKHKFETKSQLRGHQSKCKKYEHSISKILTKDVLTDLFAKGYSANKIATEYFSEYNWSANKIIGWAKKYGIRTLNNKEAANLKITRESCKKTCLKKYGDTNVLGKKSKKYKLRNKTVKEKYGVENVFQLKEVKEKIKETNLIRYGVANPCFLTKQTGRASKVQLKLQNRLMNENISFLSEECTKNLYKYNKELKKGYCPRPDIQIDNIIIEVQGDHWHCNPDRFKPDDIIVRFGGKEMKASEVWELDRIRKEHIESFGFKVLYVWEHEINNNLEEVIKRIKNEIDEN